MYPISVRFAKKIGMKGFLNIHAVSVPFLILSTFTFFGSLKGVLKGIEINRNAQNN